MNSDEIIKQKITAIMIVEVMGRPKEHLVETLEKISSDINNEPGVEVIDKKINEPHLVKDQKDLYSTYAEIEVKVEQALHLPYLVFKYMPAHIDVVEPENIKMNAPMFTDMLSGLTGKLHKYDEVARVLQMEKQILTNKVKALEESKK
jgi:hypothetical protein